jgi:hypothetical protein
VTYEWPRLDLVEHRLLEVLPHLPLRRSRQLAVDRADVHLGETVDVAEAALDLFEDAILELSAGYGCT